MPVLGYVSLFSWQFGKMEMPFLEFPCGFTLMSTSGPSKRYCNKPYLWLWLSESVKLSNLKLVNSVQFNTRHAHWQSFKPQDLIINYS